MIQYVLLVVAIGAGALITYVDTRPTWDDTGITAVVLLVFSGLLGFLGPSRPWLWALVVGSGIPLLSIVHTHSYSSLLVLAITFAGSYAGAAIRRQLWPTPR